MPSLSIVIPAFNEASRLPRTLDEARDYLDRTGRDAEIVVVDDGSTDDTVALARSREKQDARVRVIVMPQNRGKGAAVRAGMLATRGARALFMDADLATPMAELEKLERALDQGADIAIGSRALSGSHLVERQHPAREAMGRAFNLLVKAAGLTGIQDSQCGFKLFTREAAYTLFREARIDRFAFDVELLLLARNRFQVAEVPVMWRHVKESRVSPIRDAARMALDLARVRAELLLRPASAATEPHAESSSRDQYLEIDGIRVRYREEGTRDKPVLVLLHGVMASLETWDGWVERLAPHYRLLRMDLPGFGLSDEMPPDRYTPEQSALFFDRVRQALGIERFHIAGNSLGGFLGWYYAAHYPQHVEKLILVDPIAYPQKLPPIIQLVSLPGIGEAAHYVAPRPLVARNVRMVYGDPKLVSSATVDRYHAPLSRSSNRRAMVRTFRTIKALALDTELSKKVGMVKCPTMLMWGDLDRWVPVSLAKSWQRDLPGLEVKIYPGLGHIPMEEKPELTADDAHAFLSAPSR